MTHTRTGRIYKIICSKSNDVYVGSTFNVLKARMQGHQNDFVKGAMLGGYPQFAKHGWESLKMVLISEYQVVDRKHLLMYETLWISKLQPCNKQKHPFQPITAKFLQIRDKRSKPTPRKGLPSWQERVDCQCGGFYITEGIRSYLYRHLKSNIHKKWEESKKKKPRKTRK